jgi:predicted small lipoprotein YifL
VNGRARIAILGLLVAAAAVGCGQQGPLVLPDSARPIERIDPPPPASEQNDDEQQNER